jgi:hypothetical protein
LKLTSNFFKFSICQNWVYEMEKSSYIVKINTALGNRPFYIKIDHANLSLDSIISSAIYQLKSAGRPLAAKQLESLYGSHQIFNSGNHVSKGALFSELVGKTEDIQGNHVRIAEIDMIARHSGGL